MPQAKTETALVKVSVNSPQALAKFANVLKDFIVKRSLYTEIQGKNYVHVEAWEFAGICMGIAPIVRETTDLSSDTEIKHKARVELILINNGKIVGGGEAICSGNEAKNGKKIRTDEYAVLSMAQTRAVGKAFRLSYGWIMKMAGYEATSAEEMEIQSLRNEPEVLLADIEDVKKRVTAKLDTLSSIERLRAIKVTGKVKIEHLEEVHWRRLDNDLGTDKEKDATGQTPEHT